MPPSVACTEFVGPFRLIPPASRCVRMWVPGYYDVCGNLMIEILRGEKDEEKQRKLLETLGAWDLAFGASDARRDLAQLVDNARTHEGRCVPASVVFPLNR